MRFTILRRSANARAAAALALFCASNALAQDAPTDADKVVTDYFSGLNASKLEKIYRHIGVEPPEAFRNCLCPSGFHYFPNQQGGPCRRIGPLGGVSVADYAAGQIVQCAKAAPLPDGRSVLDAVRAAATQAAPAPSSDSGASADLRAEIRALEQACLPIGANIHAILDEYDAQANTYKQQLEDNAAIAADIRRGPVTRPARPAREGLVNEIRAAVAAAETPCDKAAEVALLAEYKDVRDIGKYLATLVWTVIKPAPERLEIADKAQNIVDIVDEAKTQSRHKAHAEAIEETREMLRVSRGWTREFYDQAMKSYDADADAQWNALKDAEAAYKAALAAIEQKRLKGLPASAPAQEHMQFDFAIEAARKKAKLDRDGAFEEALFRLDQIKLTTDALKTFRAPLLGRSCEQYLEESCAKSK